MGRKGIAVLLLGLAALLGGCAWLLPPAPPPAPPATAPRNLAASFGAYPDSISLTWSAVESADSYQVERDPPFPGPGGAIRTTPSPSFTDVVGAENQGKWFRYRVRACNAAGCGPWSEWGRGYAGYPPKPEGLFASRGDYPDKIALAWDLMPGATYYQIFRDPSPDPNCRGLCRLADDVRTNTYEDRAVRVGLRYRYAIRACNDHGCSELSDTVYGCVNPCPLPFAIDEGGS